MRDFKGMKRQRGRNRGGGNQSGGNKQQHNVNRAFDSNGPDGVKIRGHAQHVYEKYQQLARDASGSGDRVLAENYLQHAEHYFRVLRAVQPQRPVAEILGRDNLQAYEIDFEDESGGQAFIDNPPEPGHGQSEGGEGEGGEQQPRSEYQSRDNQNRDGQPREWRDRDRDRNRDRDGNQPRQEGQPRQDRDQARQDRDNSQPRQERTYDRPRRDRDRDRDRDRNREDRPADPAPVIEPEAAPLAAARPPSQDGFALRDAEGQISPAPAFLQARSPASAAAESGEAEKKPRRTRRRAPREGFESGEGGASPAETEEV